MFHESVYIKSCRWLVHMFTAPISFTLTTIQAEEPRLYGGAACRPRTMGRWTQWCLDGNPELHPELPLVLSVSQPSSTWEAVEEDPSQFPYGRDTTAGLRTVAALGKGDGYSEGSFVSNPVRRNTLNYRTQVDEQTDARANAPVLNTRPARVVEERARGAPPGTTIPQKELACPLGC